MTQEQLLAAKCAEFAAALDDWQIAEALNAPDPAFAVSGARPDTQTVAVRAILIDAGAMGVISDAADHATDASTRVLCKNFLAGLDLGSVQTSVETTYIKAANQIAAVVAADLMNQQTADRILALAAAPTINRSWAQANGFESLTAADIACARGKQMFVQE